MDDCILYAIVLDDTLTIEVEDIVENDDSKEE